MVRWMPLFLLMGCWPGDLPPCPDCAENDDVDGDGFTPREGDCDDADADRSPDATELCNNGIDDDCDGLAGSCVRRGTFDLGAPDSRAVGGRLGARYGTTARLAGDRLWVGGPGVSNGGIVRLALPLDDEDLEEAAVASLRGGVLDHLGSQLAASDVQIASRVPTLGQAGDVFVFPADLTGAVGDLAGASEARLVGEADGDLGGDFLAMGPAGGLLASTRRDGQVAWWVENPPLGSNPVSSVGTAVIGPTLPTVARVGDLDGDGNDDLVFGMADADVQGVLGAGEVVVLPGPVGASPSLASSGVRYRGRAASGEAGRAVTLLDDLDGDGLPELLVAGRQADAGRAWVVAGGAASGDLDDVATVVITGPGGVDLGHAAVLDFDGDGDLDLAVGAPDVGLLGGGAGSVYLWYGPLAAELSTDSADLVLVGAAAGDQAGQVVLAADVNQDGVDDLVVGAPGDSTLAELGGGVLAVYGRGL